MWNTDVLPKDDLQLTALVAERNQQAMDYIYDTYSPALYGIIYRITNNKHLAEECLLTTFVKAWNDVAAFHGSGTSFFTWLLHLARKVALEASARETEKTPACHNSVNGYDQHYSGFELVYLKGLSMVQASVLLGVTVIELKIDIRMELQNRRNKTEKHDE